MTRTRAVAGFLITALTVRGYYHATMGDSSLRLQKRLVQFLFATLASSFASFAVKPTAETAKFAKKTQSYAKKRV
jgi:hypothetical protein